MTLYGRLDFSDGNGGIWRTEKIESGTSPAGFASAVPDDRDGYTFVSWSLDAGQTDYADENGRVTATNVVEFTDEAMTVGGETIIAENELTVYPVWVRDRVQVILVPGEDADMGIGHDGKPQRELFFLEIGEPIYMSGMNAATRPGYALTGWYTGDSIQWTDNMAAEPDYCDKADGEILIRTDSDRRFKYYTLTLTAGWDTGYSVTVTNGEGSGVYLYEGLVMVAAKIPKGTVFTGWTGTEEITLVDGSAETKYIAFYMPKHDVSLTAEFETVSYGTADFTLPADIRSVGEEAFEGAEMTTVFIPDGCVSIGSGAFRNCEYLTRIRIPESVTDIGTNVFDGCEKVIVFGIVDSKAEDYCTAYDNLVFAEE